MKYIDKYKDEFWFPEKVDENYIKKLREVYPEETENMTNNEVHERYCDGQKYATLWDHVGEAYCDYEGLADAFFELLNVVDNTVK